MSVTEMKMSRWMSGNTIKYMIWNEEIHLKIHVSLIDENVRELFEMI